MKRSRNHESGATATEVAVLMPVLIALVLAVFQVGLLWHAKQVADGAARQAVDRAQVADATAADGEQAARAFLTQAGNLTSPVVTVTRSADLVTAEVAGRAPQLIPGPTWAVTARATGNVEVFIPEPQR